MHLYIALLFQLLTPFVSSLDNGIARTPPMGWLQWERFRCITDCKTYPDQCVKAELFKQIADRMAEDGYLEAGYNYINIDDCWAEHQRDENMNMVPDKSRFPDGMKPVVDYIHSKDIKMGIYTDFGTLTCGGYPGSIYHMQKDSEMFAAWGIDMLKVDGCYVATSMMPSGYPVLGQYLNATGRKILYSCSWPAYVNAKPYKAIAQHCNIWRNWADIQDNFNSVLSIINYNGDHQDEITQYVGPGAFNDPDMLLIGDYSLSEDESKLQFAIWSIMAAPLFMSNDLRNMKQWQKDILLNKEVIAVNQDPLGLMGRRVYKSGSQQTWMKKLEDGRYAVAMMSTRSDNPVYMSFTDKQLGVKGNFTVLDLYSGEHLSPFTTRCSAMVNPHGVVMLSLTPVQHDADQHDADDDFLFF